MPFLCIMKPYLTRKRFSTLNFKYGKEMTQKVQAYVLYSSGLNQSVIVEKLKHQFGKSAISLRTLNRWISNFKKIPKSITQLDEPFQWDKCDYYDISWANSQKLLELCHYYYENNDQVPSGRQAKWWIRISQAAPDLKAGQISEVGNLYSWREIGGILEGKSPIYDDLNAYITHKPYHTNRIRTYARYINANGLTPIKPKSDKSNSRGGLKNAL